ncbi:MAG: hypothetical protein GY847_04795 [Proteobacteria bacterium]|nr:hypothetical protein [Pseudomonadota bacterium]
MGRSSLARSFDPDITCDGRISEGNFFVDYKSPYNVFSINPLDPRDGDKDGIIDEVESTLADVFAPAGPPSICRKRPGEIYKSV